MRRTVASLALALASVGAEAACARAQNPPAGTVPAAAADSVVVPPGVYGSLSQNEIAVRLRTDDLEIRFVPLDLRITTLLARDGAESLQRLVERNRPAIDSAGRAAGVSEPGLALVTFFAQQPGARFDPELVTLTARNQLVRPMAIVPLSPRFGAAQLEARESAMAVYIFEELLPVWEPFTVNYENLVSREWERRLPQLQRERDRLAATPR
ncbi:MAG TPA: hypothetical protein VFZ13_08490 [Gemmatimonadales bacterium]